MNYNSFLRYSVLLFSILLMFSISVNAADYYVATTGNNSNAGTIAAPWLTVQKAANTMVAGDTAYVRSGTYNESMINFTNSGTAGSPITIKGYPGEIAVIDGGFTTASGRLPVFDIDGENYITLDGLTIKRGSTANVFIAYNNTDLNISIKNCDFQDFVASDNSAHIYIDSGGGDITIEKNRLHGYLGSTAGNAAGIIIFHAGNLTIKNNEIYSTYQGIYYKHSTDDGSSTLIENNFIYNQTGRWGIQSSRKGTIIRNNVIQNVSGTGIRVYEESASCPNLVSSDNQLLHNTIVDVSVGIMLDRGNSSGCPGAVNTIVRDNVVYNCSDSGLRCVAVYPYYSTDSSATTFENNIIYSSFTSPIRVLSSYYTTSSVPLAGSNNQQAQPLFRNYTNNDFTLTSASPGAKAASDGTNMGAKVSAVGPNPAPSAPQITIK